MKTLNEFLADAAEILDEAASAVGLRPDAIQAIVDEETEHFRATVSVTNRTSLPDTTDIPITNPTNWIKIPDVIACFVDMEGSTQLSADTHPNTTAKCYRYFVNTAVRIFHEMESPYIDVRGDGVLAMFDHNKAHRALASVVSFKTFVANEFTPRVKTVADDKVIGGHYGIDCGAVLVRKMGLKAVQGRSDRQNEVWAGKPVNMAAKLASSSTHNQVWVSDRFYNKLTGDKARISCGCDSEGTPKELWTEVDIASDARFDFDKARVLKSNWCKTHGKQYLRDIVRSDK